MLLQVVDMGVISSRSSVMSGYCRQQAGAIAEVQVDCLP
jgi:hypothetical protein